MNRLKQIVVSLVLLAGFFVAWGCINSNPSNPPLSKVGQILQGEHKLRKMTKEHTNVHSRLSGSFFLLIGDIHGETDQKVTVRFAWEMNDGTYSISSLPLEKIRVKLDEKTSTPTIKFRWVGHDYMASNTQFVMDRDIIYAVLTIKESDWPVQINLPLNQ